MMQSRRREHHGELDVFGATSYFAGLPPPAPSPDDDDCRCRPSSASTEPPADRLYLQAKVVQQRDTMTRTMGDNSFRGPHQQLLAGRLPGHAERHAANNKQLQLQVVAANKRHHPQQPSASGKSRLAALLSFVVSPSSSPRAASFRKEKHKKKQQEEAPSTTTTRLRQATKAASAPGGAANKNTYKQAATSPSSSSRASSSMQLQLQGLLGDDDVDLGAATGDRRLQGITVVRGIGGGEERRWVVRCVPGPAGAWDDDEEQRRDKVLDAAAESGSSQGHNLKDGLVEVDVEQLQGDGGDAGNGDPAHSWDSDSSSDLFDLDIVY